MRSARPRTRRLPLPPSVAAAGVLARPVGRAPLDLAGGGINAFFLRYDAARKLCFRVLLPDVGQNHAVHDAPSFMPANRTFLGSSSFPCRVIFSHAGNLPAGLDISGTYKKFLAQSAFCKQPVRFTPSLFYGSAGKPTSPTFQVYTPFFALRRHGQ